MKTVYKYIGFTKEKGLCNIDDIWRCKNKKGVTLGFVAYVEKWEEWEFQPESYMGFTIECLRDIAHFIGQLNNS